MRYGTIVKCYAVVKDSAGTAGVLQQQVYLKG